MTNRFKDALSEVEAWLKSINYVECESDYPYIYKDGEEGMVNASETILEALVIADKHDEMKEKMFDLLALDIARDNMGIYPAAITGGPNAYEKRTERMEGHNGYAMEYSKKVTKIRKFLESTPDSIKDLLLQEKVNIDANKDEIALWVDCNDLFYWACGDGEDITMEEIPELEQALSESPNNGGILWICRKRKMRPQAAYYKYFTAEEEVLFDAAGEERTDSDGKKHDKTSDSSTRALVTEPSQNGGA